MSYLAVIRGDDEALLVTLTEADGATPVPLDGCTLWFTAKARLIDPDTAAIIAKSSAPGQGITITDAPAGEATIELTPNDTAALQSVALWADLQLMDDSGKVQTPWKGRLVIEADVTARTVVVP